ncbi:iron complex transport system substrate-binding protein [Rhodococcus sp. 27YEA15]|uniref:ABC transporter substrate-binding protein n=1 Tax=Rhodococcus sp. 27YEA15 TaxID=3156259 RepID=UPI003C79D858
MGTRWKSWTAVVGLAVILGATLSACDSGGDSRGDAPASATDAAFPVTVSTTHGDVTIPTRPTRVIALSDDYLSPIVALGTMPVAYRTDGPNAAVPLGPWVADALEGADVEVIPAGQINVEQLAALEPDLIAGPQWLIDDNMFAVLDAIAPTITHTDSGKGTERGAWEGQTRQIGLALGVSDEAEALIGRANDAIDGIRTSNPQIAGKSIAVAYVLGEQVAFVNSPDASAGRFLSALGFATATIDPSRSDERVGVSREQLSLLDNADVLVVSGTSPQSLSDLEADPLYRNLDVVRADRVLATDITVSAGFNSPNAASIPYLIDLLKPYVGRL